jgi:hypothetical protein
MNQSEKNAQKATGGAETIDVFVQAEGQSKIGTVKVSSTETVRGLIDAAERDGMSPSRGSGTTVASLEDADEPARLDDTLAESGIVHRSRVHIHRCRRVDVKVFFNGRTIERQFPPAATIGKVTEWAVGKKGFILDAADAVEHVLQISGTTQRPDEDEHLGTLVNASTCAVSFDLVPKQRVEG